jgi:hypothetical protein
MTKSLEQTESLLNSHHLRFNGVTVDDTAERDGGKQCIQVDEVIIKLDFLDQATLSFETILLYHNMMSARRALDANTDAEKRL